MPVLANLTSIKKKVEKLLKRTKPRAAIKTKDLEVMVQSESSAGRGKTPPRSKFVTNEKNQLLRPKISSKTQPRWVRSLAEKKVNSQLTAKATLLLLEKFPVGSNLIVSQNVLNDLGRKPGGGPLLHKMITQKLVAGIIEKGK